ncbi:unnamed protein product, partial [Diabrotica balteata]
MGLKRKVYIPICFTCTNLWSRDLTLTQKSANNSELHKSHGTCNAEREPSRPHNKTNKLGKDQ